MFKSLDRHQHVTYRFFIEPQDILYGTSAPIKDLQRHLVLKVLKGSWLLLLHINLRFLLFIVLMLWGTMWLALRIFSAVTIKPGKKTSAWRSIVSLYQHLLGHSCHDLARGACAQGLILG